MLENKLGITDSLVLAHEEERITKIKAFEIYASGIVDELEVGTFDALAQIHYHLFNDIYEFAGQLRTVDISKGGFRFAPSIYLEAAVEAITAMPHETFEEIVAKYVEMNVAHPFREGNGRATRIWLDSILKDVIGCVVDWAKISREEYLLAMERSPVRDLELRHLLVDALTEDVTNRSVLARSIDASYKYEGYTAYVTETLLQSRNSVNVSEETSLQRHDLLNPDMYGNDYGGPQR